MLVENTPIAVVIASEVTLALRCSYTIQSIRILQLSWFFKAAIAVVKVTQYILINISFLCSFFVMWLVSSVQSGYPTGALIGQNRDALRPPAGLSRVIQPRVCLCTSVQWLELSAVFLVQAKCVLHKSSHTHGAPSAGLSRVIHPRVCLCTSVQWLE